MPAQPASREPPEASGNTPLTWTSLLAHFTALAQASLALPKTTEGDRWRSAVPDIIGLQAVTHALADLHALPSPAERRLGQDKAEVLINQHARSLSELWRAEPFPAELEEIVSDARAALDATRSSGAEWTAPRAGHADALELDHPAELIEALLALGFRGDLFLATPGVSIMPGSPIAFAREAGGGEPSTDAQKQISRFLGLPGQPARRPRFRQVYRQFDFGTGTIKRDLVVPDDRLVPGQPLLVPVIQRGQPVAVTLPPPPGAIDRVRGVPVETEE